MDMEDSEDRRLDTAGVGGIWTFAASWARLVGVSLGVDRRSMARGLTCYW